MEFHPAASPSASSLPQHIGKYELQERPGQGRFIGIVYRAYDPTLHRHVAIKILSTEAQTNSEILERFRVEAGTTANLHHKNIVTVLDYDVHNGSPSIVIDLLEGEDPKNSFSSCGISNSISASLKKYAS